MALALRQLELFTSQEQTNIVTVVFHFSWFNYHPYLKDFTFKKNIFEADEVKNPIDSNAYRLLYEAEQQRLHYAPMISLNSTTNISFSEYRTIAKTNYTKLKNDYDKYKRIARSSNTTEPFTREQVLEIGFQSNELLDGIFGSMSSQAENITFNDLIASIDKTVKDTSSAFSIFSDTSWKVVVLNDGNPIKLPTQLKTSKATEEELKQQKLNEISERDIVLLKRDHNIDLQKAGIIVTGIHISFENILATLPMSGYSYPTFQHIGSVDAVVSLSFLTNSESAQRTITNMLNIYNEQSIRNRNVPQGHRNLHIENNLLQMCGLKDFIVESKQIQTVLRQPDLSAGVLIFLDDSLNQETKEQITSGQSFTTSFDIRNAIAKVISDKIKLVDGAFKFDTKGFATLDPAVGIANKIIAPISTPAFYESMSTTVQTSSYSVGYYRYTGEDNINHLQFKTLCEEYGRNLSLLLAKLVKFLQAKFVEYIYNFFGLSDQDIIGVEKIQQDLLPIFQNNKNINRGLIRPTQTLQSLRLSSRDKIVEQQVISEEAFKKSEDPEDLQNKTVVFVQKMLSDWQNFSTEFLDKILYSGLIDLEEFKTVKDLINKNALSSATCYPDFPLENVLNILSTSKNEDLKAAYKSFVEDFDKTKLATHNLGLVSLLNPDFYFYNHVEDIENLVSPDLVSRAVEGIISAREKMVEEEKDWFKNVYKDHIYQRDDRTTSILGQIFAQAKSVFSDTTPGKKYASQVKTGDVFLPNQLTGSIASSIKQAEKNSKPEDKVISIKATLPEDKQNVTTNEREKAVLSSSKNKNIKHYFDTVNVLAPQAEHGSRIADIITKRPPFDQLKIDLINIKRIYLKDGWHELRTDAAVKFNEMAEEAQERDGLTLQVSSAYRSTEKQAELYADYQARLRGEPTPYGGEGNLAAKPESSMHEVGLAVDINVDRRNDSYEYLWLAANAARFGFANTGQYFPKQQEWWHWEFFPDAVGDADPISGSDSSINPNSESLLTKSLDQLQNDLYKNQSYSMMKAYPTFKLYFIESDLGERKRYAFDDFFNYSAVKSIQQIRSRKIAADLLLLELTNISGVLSNRRFQEATDPTKPRDTSGLTFEGFQASKTNTAGENPIASLMLQPGVQIQLRLGYCNNPEDLETTFNGIITDVEFSETDDLVTVICQSFAVELQQTIHGETKSLGGWFSGDGRTFKILEEVLASPEVVHFGRWDGGDWGKNTQRSLLTKRWTFVPSPADDNIFAPQGDSALGLIDAFIGTNKYVMYQTTLWDVIQEMTLRHPSYIASAVPFTEKGGNPRMTLFFGVPDQLYFARDSSFTEDATISQVRGVADGGEVTDETEARTRDAARDGTVETQAAILETTKNSPYRKRYFDLWRKNYALDKGFIKPFRNYHIATSSLNIIYNSISNSGFNVYNTATIQYGKSAAEPNENTGNLDFAKSDTYTLKADGALSDEESREIFLQYPNCIGEEVAKTYCLSVLFNSLKESYKGSIVLIGNPKIKPFDIVYLFDEYNDCYGPIEVEQVVHKFSQETGFVTEVTPNMVVHVNQHATLSTSDAMGYMVEESLKKMGMPSTPLAALKIANNIGSIPFSPIAALFFNSAEHTLSTGTNNSPFSLIGTFIFKKLITRTQLSHPFRFSPIILQGHPMIGGLPNRKTDGGFFQPLGEWKKDMSDYGSQYLDYLLERTNPNNWFGKTNGEIELLNK
jgi:LAS superfamily LD-carboxypeptidase LdcB